uniref:Uncharacterized protein n=1 Tax=Anopheles melas TaxID=34690 RepID=A0A182UK71_9DIPT
MRGSSVDVAGLGLGLSLERRPLYRLKLTRRSEPRSVTVVSGSSVVVRPSANRLAASCSLAAVGLVRRRLTVCVVVVVVAGFLVLVNLKTELEVASLVGGLVATVVDGTDGVVVAVVAVARLLLLLLAVVVTLGAAVSSSSGPSYGEPNRLSGLANVSLPPTKPASSTLLPVTLSPVLGTAVVTSSVVSAGQPDALLPSLLLPVSSARCSVGPIGTVVSVTSASDARSLSKPAVVGFGPALLRFTVCGSSSSSSCSSSAGSSPSTSDCGCSATVVGRCRLMLTYFGTAVGRPVVNVDGWFSSSSMSSSSSYRSSIEAAFVGRARCSVTYFGFSRNTPSNSGSWSRPSFCGPTRLFVYELRTTDEYLFSGSEPVRSCCCVNVMAGRNFWPTLPVRLSTRSYSDLLMVGAVVDTGSASAPFSRIEPSSWACSCFSSSSMPPTFLISAISSLITFGSSSGCVSSASTVGSVVVVVVVVVKMPRLKKLFRLVATVMRGRAVVDVVGAAAVVVVEVVVLVVEEVVDGAVLEQITLRA